MQGIYAHIEDIYSLFLYAMSNMHVHCHMTALDMYICLL